MDKLKKQNVVLLIICVWSFLYWRIAGRVLSINNLANPDDIASIQFALCGDNIWSQIGGIIKNDPTNVPLYYILLRGWIKIFGLEISKLRILPEIMGAISVFFIGKCTEHRAGKCAGYLSAIIAGGSIQLFYAAYQVRAYSLLICMSAILFYTWMNKESIKFGYACYTLALLLTSFTHFFGVLLCGALGIYDFISTIIKRKNFWLMIKSYIVYVVIFIPYLFISYINASDMYGSFWPPVPGIKDYFKMFGDLCPDGNIFILLFGMAFVSILAFCVEKKQISNYIINIWSIWFVITVGFVYSKYIKPTSSVWVFRYFLVVFPMVIDLISIAIKETIVFGTAIKKIPRYIAVAFVIFLTGAYGYTRYDIIEKNVYDRIALGEMPYEQIWNSLTNEPDIFKNETVVVFNYPEVYYEGLKKYLSADGEKTYPQVVYDDAQFASKVTECSNVYVVTFVGQLTEQQQQLLEENGFVINEEMQMPYVQKYEQASR